MTSVPHAYSTESTVFRSFDDQRAKESVGSASDKGKVCFTPRDGKEREWSLDERIAGAPHKPKRFIGAARNIEEGEFITILPPRSSKRVQAIAT